MLTIFQGANGWFFLAEASIVLYIMWWQWQSASETANKIEDFRSILPFKSAFMLTSVPVPVSVLRRDAPEEIIQNMHLYLQRVANNDPRDETLEVPILGADTTKEPAFITILSNLNTYLVRNRGAVADFHLVKDIVERQLDAERDEIQTALPTPLYIGLMGTMIGIVMGLGAFVFKIADTGVEGNFSEGITFLLIGVITSMAASAFGLYLTTRNSVYRFRGAARQVEALKNDFFTFLQTELLPVLSQSVNTGIHALQLNFSQFNQSFTKNLRELHQIVTVNFKGVSAHQQILEELNRVDVNRMALMNVEVFREIKTSLDALQNLGKYVSKLEQFIAGTTALTESVNELLERTDDFGVIAEKVEGSLVQSGELTEFLHRHFSDLDKSGQLLTESVMKVNKILDQSIGTLERETAVRIQAFREFTTQEQSRMETAILDPRSSLSKLNRLDDVHQMLQSSVSAQTKNTKTLHDGLDKLQKTLIDVGETLSTPSESSKKWYHKADRFFHWANRIGLFVLVVTILTLIARQIMLGQL